jgi:hypothetical protein
MRRVLLMVGEAVGMLGNIAKVQVSKFMAAVISYELAGFAFYSYTRWANSVTGSDKNCVDMGSNPANMRYTISPLFVQRSELLRSYTSIKETWYMSEETMHIL